MATTSEAHGELTQPALELACVQNCLTTAMSDVACEPRITNRTVCSQITTDLVEEALLRSEASRRIYPRWRSPRDSL